MHNSNFRRLASSLTLAFGFVVVARPVLSGPIDFTTVNYPGAASTEALGINNQGQIVGYYYDTSGDQHGFLYSGGAFSTIAFPGGPWQGATGINDSGQIVGYSADMNRGAYQGYVYNGGNFTPINYPGAAFSVPFDINSSGLIVGEYGIAGYFSPSHGYLDNAGTFTSLDFPGASQTAIWGISASGNMVGLYYNPVLHGFLNANGTYTSIDFPGSVEQTQASRMNSAGEIVGWYKDASGAVHGFERLGTDYQSVDYPGATMTELYGINDLGQLVGFYSNGTSVNGFLATTATPEPASASLLALAGVLGLCLQLERKRHS